MNRRHFVITTSLSSFAFGFLGYKIDYLLCPSNLDRLAKPQLLATLATEREILSIGRMYREKNKSENDVFHLRIKIEETIRRQSFSPYKSIKKAITDDFRQGRTTQLNGWILSITEARQCALYSLLYP